MLPALAPAYGATPAPKNVLADTIKAEDARVLTMGRTEAMADGRQDRSVEPG